MAALSWRLEQLLPHRAPMILIDRVVDFDPEEKAVTVAFKPKSPWLGNHVAIEYMAQAAAALVGVADRMEFPDRPPRPGFLLGTRKMELLLESFDPQQEYFATAKYEFADRGAASFACRIEVQGQCVASALLNAYRPDDVQDFLASH